MSINQKTLEFKLKADTAEFDKAVEAMKRQLKDIYAPADFIRQSNTIGQKTAQAGFGGMNVGATQDFNRVSQQSKRQHDEMIRKQMKDLEDLGKEVVKSNKSMQSMVEIQKNVVKGSERELHLVSEIAKKREEIAQKSSQYSAQSKLLGANVDMRESRNEPPKQGMQIDPSMIMKGVATAIAVISGGVAAYDSYSSIPLRRNTSTGNATQSLLGGELNRDAISQQAWMPERAKAMQMARDRNESSTKSDYAKAAMGLGTFGMGGGWDLQAGGASSSLSGSLKNGFMGGMPGMGSITKMLDKYSEEHMSAYSAQKAEQMGQNYQQMAADEVKKNPLKNLAVTQFGQNYGKDLEAQRMMGLGFDGYHGKGGFQEQSNNAGFSSDMGVQMAQGIGSAGGSTRSMRGNSVLGMQMSRGMDLTNSGQILGNISGMAGSSQATQAIAMKIMEESIKNGLDKSEFRAENRKFSEIASSIIARSSAKSPEDVQNVLSSFSKLVGGTPTMKGLEGASQAHDEFQALTSSTSGRFGATQFAAMKKDPQLSKLSNKSFGALMELDQDQVTSTNSTIVAYARESGLTPQILAERIRAAKGLSVGSGAQISDADTKLLKDEDLSKVTFEKTMSWSKEKYNAYNKLIGNSRAIFGKGSDEKSVANAASLMPNAPDSDGRVGFGFTASEELQGKLGAKKTGRNEDDVVTSMATQSQAFLENFRGFAKEITPASDAVKEFTKKIILLSAALQLVPDKDKGDAARATANSTYPEQNNAEKPTPGGK